MELYGMKNCVRFHSLWSFPISLSFFLNSCCSLWLVLKWNEPGLQGSNLTALELKLLRNGVNTVILKRSQKQAKSAISCKEDGRAARSSQTWMEPWPKETSARLPGKAQWATLILGLRSSRDCISDTLGTLHMAHNLQESFFIFKWKQNNNRSLGKDIMKNDCWKLKNFENGGQKKYRVLTQHEIGLLLEYLFLSLRKQIMHYSAFIVVTAFRLSCCYCSKDIRSI